MSRATSNLDVTGPVAIRTGQQVGDPTIGLFITDDAGPYAPPFLQMFGTEENLRAFAESILTAITTHTESRPTGEPS